MTTRHSLRRPRRPDLHGPDRSEPVVTGAGAGVAEPAHPTAASAALRPPHGLRPRVRGRPRQLARLPAGHAAGRGRRARPRRGQPDAAQVPRPPAGRDQQARRRSTCCATGVKHGPHQLDLFYGTPVAGQRQGRASGTRQNRFSVTRQLRYSRDETQLALDLGLFINGLPVATFELKNSLTKQTVADAVEQYQRDRDPRERLFEFGRCIVHFAVDDQRGAVLHRTSRARRRGSCRSTRAGTTARATRRTPTGSRPTTSGSGS